MFNNTIVGNTYKSRLINSSISRINLFAFVTTLVSTYKHIGKQKKFIQKSIVPFLSSLEQDCGGIIPPYQKRKILSYYALLVPSILAVQYRRLYGQAFTEKDRWSATLTGLFSPIADDMFDVEKLSVERLSALAFDPLTKAQTFNEKIFTVVNNMLMDTAADKKAYLNILRTVAQSQANSLQQYQAGIEKDDLEKITYSKAWAAFMYYHIHMMGSPTSEVADVLYKIAGLHQMCNDIFDIYKDWNENVYTLANTCNDFSRFKHCFLDRVRVQNQKIMQLPYKQKDKAHFALVMQLIEARALVVIDHFVDLENQHGKKLDWSMFERKDLVVDIDKPINFIKWCRNVIKLHLMN